MMRLRRIESRIMYGSQNGVAMSTRKKGIAQMPMAARMILRTIAFILALFIAPVALAQVPVTLSPVPRMQFLDSSGRPLSGGFVYTYISGTSTPLATYKDVSGTSENTNPIVLDSGGFAAIWLQSSSAYRIKVYNFGGTMQWLVDGITSPPNLLAPGPIGTSVPNVVEATYFLTATALPALSGAVRLASGDQLCWRNNANSGDVCISKNSSDVFSVTNLTVAGNLLAGTFDNVVYADQQAGADTGAKINAADTQLGTSPGEIWCSNVLSGTPVTTPITIHSGHTLRFTQGGYWTFTVPITLEQGASIIGSGPWISTATSSTGTVFFHNFSGDFIIYSGAATGTGTLGGGVLQNFSLYNIYSGGDLNGNAIEITGTALLLRADDVVIDRVYVDGNSATNRWTRGLYVDGTPIGGTDGVRNITVRDSRFHSSGTNNEDIRIENAFNTVLDNVKITSSNNGAQTPGITITGSSGNVSSGAQLFGVNTVNLALDWANSVDVEGGFYSAITNTANSGASVVLRPANLTNIFVNNGSAATTAVYPDPINPGQTIVLGSIAVTGNETLATLAGTGTRCVSSNASGLLGNSCAFGVQSVTSTTMSGDQTYTTGAAATITGLTHAVTMPSAGGPFRALVCYGVYWTTGASATSANVWVTDSTTVFASTEAGGGTSPVPYSGNATCGMSTGTGYANGANVTFTAKINANQNLTVRQSGTNAGGTSSWMTVSILPSAN